MVAVVVGLGGNLGSPHDAFSHGVAKLSSAAQILGWSHVFRSRAIGPPQPDYLNAAVLVEWSRDPRSLLELCHGLEAAAGRDRSREERWGPRPLDLDLLIADGVVCRGPRLTLPHPRLAERAFALVPAAEVAGDWIHPFRGHSLRELADAVCAASPEKALVVEGSL